jgi:sortase A
MQLTFVGHYSISDSIILENRGPIRFIAASYVEQRGWRNCALGLPLKIVERSLFAGGAVLCLVYVGVTAYRSASSRLAVRSFDATKGAAESLVPKNRAVELPSSAVDFRHWASKRIAAYEESLARQFSPPIAVLRVPKVGIEVPVFDGTDEVILNRGVGRIAGTARPGETGNLGIAGHRDGFFRALKDIAVGDSVSLDSGANASDYVVESMTIVVPSDVTVLARTPRPCITLVTCYPFYHLGDAPRRFIVRCVLKEPQGPGGGSSTAASQ